MENRQIVKITSHFTVKEDDGWQIVAYDIPRGNVAAFPEANVLVPLDSTADISNAQHQNGLS